MIEYTYLTRLVTDRAAIRRIDDAKDDFEAQIHLLRYAEAESRAELATLQAELGVARETVEELEQMLAIARREAAEELEQALAVARHEAAEELEQALAVARHEAAMARETLQAVYRSTSWRLAGPLRRMVRLVRGATPFVLDLAYDVATRIISNRLVRLVRGTTPFVPNLGYNVATKIIIKRYLSEAAEELPRPLHAQLGSAEMVARRLAAVPSRATVAMSLLPASYTVVTPYFAHYAHFARCAESVTAMLEADVAHRAAPRLQWIVVNDDPSCPDDRLRAMLPAALLPYTTFLSSGRNEGIVAAQNRGVRAAANPWILMLDCDDAIESNALAVLDLYIGQFPACRYFSSLMTDIDENSHELRRRRRDASTSCLFGAGMVVGHLVAFRRDLFDELDGFDPRFSGVQDYDFALRAAAREPLQQIPEYLYRYRWHGGSQSVSRAKRQVRLADGVRSSFLRGLLPPNVSRPLVTAPLPAVPRCLCIIRTQGTRIELLASAVASVQQQGISITPCIVVHGDEETCGMVERQLLRKMGPTSGPQPVFLAAPELTRRRGYPCNVGLDFLYAHADRFDLLCFLDDDDHMLPNFGTRLVEIMRQRGADLAYGMTNALPVSGEPIPQHHLLPSVSLFGANFIPINSYLVRTDVLLAVKARFDETLDYLEDWDFLIQVVGGGAQAVPLFETVAEYRLIGDGNTLQRKDTKHFKHCLSVVQQRGAKAARRFSSDRFWSDVLDFPADRRMPLTPVEKAMLMVVKALCVGKEA